jgi:anti-anti-sigma regulatory factor
MLRITKIAENGSPVTLKLEGKIHAEWVSLLEQECRMLVGQKKTVILDFSDVTFIDDRGVEMIRRLPASSIRIINGDSFIEDLLDRGGKP